MNRFLKYEWRPHDGGTQIAFNFEGTIVDATAAICRLIQQFYDKIDDRAKPAFAVACKRLMDEDSPVWHLEREAMIVIDLKELCRQTEAMENEQ